jgi:hypothetical protein
LPHGKEGDCPALAKKCTEAASLGLAADRAASRRLILSLVHIKMEMDSLE